LAYKDSVHRIKNLKRHLSGLQICIYCNNKLFNGIYHDYTGVTQQIEDFTGKLLFILELNKILTAKSMKCAVNK